MKRPLYAQYGKHYNNRRHAVQAECPVGKPDISAHYEHAVVTAIEHRRSRSKIVNVHAIYTYSLRFTFLSASSQRDSKRPRYNADSHCLCIESAPRSCSRTARLRVAGSSAVLYAHRSTAYGTQHSGCLRCVVQRVASAAYCAVTPVASVRQQGCCMFARCCNASVVWQASPALARQGLRSVKQRNARRHVTAVKGQQAAQRRAPRRRTTVCCYAAGRHTQQHEWRCKRSDD